MWTISMVSHQYSQWTSVLVYSRRMTISVNPAYSYILSISHYAPNTFSELPNFQKRWILANSVCESQFLRLLTNLCDNARECWRIFGIRLFSPIRELEYVWFRLTIRTSAEGLIFLHWFFDLTSSRFCLQHNQIISITKFIALTKIHIKNSKFFTYELWNQVWD